jgi:uncharacterized protein YeaO (DUF488 family)
VRSLPRITLGDFEGGLRGFGFADVHGPEQMALEGFDRFAATGANHARCAILARWDGLKFVLPPQQLAALQRNATEFQRRRAYMTVVLCIPEPEHILLWHSVPWAITSVIEIWRAVARLFRGRTVIAGFDLLNEPKLTGPRQDQPYWSLMNTLVKEVRSIDPQRICITSTWPGGVCQTNPEWGQWIEHIPGTVLTAHNYSPFEFTHQDLMDWTTPGKQYDPYMHTTLQAQHTSLLWLRDHHLKTGQPIWIGECSARQDRPGGTEWARHAVEMYDAFRFSWSWHYFIGPAVWHPADNTLAVLQRSFAKVR